MPFPETVKGNVRRRANHRCCVCRELFIDVHHIVPESEDGPSTEDNAAPLCQNCHRRYGNNPDHRKTLREMRDNWYSDCSSTGEQLEDIKATLDGVAENIRRLVERSGETRAQQVGFAAVLLCAAMSAGPRAAWDRRVPHTLRELAAVAPHSNEGGLAFSEPHNTLLALGLMCRCACFAAPRYALALLALATREPQTPIVDLVPRIVGLKPEQVLAEARAFLPDGIEPALIDKVIGPD